MTLVPYIMPHTSRIVYIMGQESIKSVLQNSMFSRKKENVFSSKPYFWILPTGLTKNFLSDFLKYFCFYLENM